MTVVHGRRRCGDAEQVGVIRTLFLPILMVLIGIALIVRTLVEGADGVAFGLILGALFVATGAGRLWLRNRP